jgi:predicted ATPase
MFLESVSIRHFKSLDDINVRFTPITVIVGPNGVGKSNFVDALKFFRDIARDGLDHAVSSREGIDRIRQTYKSRPFNIGLDLDFEGKKPELGTTRYGLVLSGKEGDYRVESESASCVATQYLWNEARDSAEERSFVQTFERKRDGLLSIDGQTFDKRIRPDVVALGQSVDLDELGGSITAFARNWHFCSLYPNTLRKLSPPTKEDGLAEDGSNWASVVRALKRTKSGRSALERIAEVMRIAVDGYVDIAVEAAGSYLVPRMTLAGHRGTSEKQQRFDPIQLSDGTLRVFGILLALYQQPAPSLLVIEEPEQTIHPGVLPALAEACKEASQRTQIVITTHSPHLVDQFSPDDIRIAWLHEGLTRISNIRSTQKEAVKRRLMSLQEYMLAEGLQPESSAQ